MRWEPIRRSPCIVGSRHAQFAVPEAEAVCLDAQREAIRTSLANLAALSALTVD